MKFLKNTKRLNQFVSDYFDLALVFFVLLASYAIKFANIIELDLVIVGWISVVLYAMYKVKINSFIFTAVFYVVLLLAYSSGIAFVSLNPNDFEYGRVIFTSFILSALVFGLMVEKKSISNIPIKKSSRDRWFVYFGLIAITIWSIFVYIEGKNTGGSVIKEYGGANYLTISDLLAMFSLAVLGSKNISTKESLIFFVISLVALGLLGSRASLLVFCCAYIFCLKQIPIKNKLFIFFAVSLIIISFIYVVQNEESDLFFRLKTLYDFGNDESLVGREFLFSSYLSTIAQRSECLLLPCMPAPGDYVHNIISVHQYFGIFGILAVLVLVLFAFIYLMRFQFFILPGLFFYASINMLFARAWVSLIFPVFIGMLLFFTAQVFVANRFKKPYFGKDI